MLEFCSWLSRRWYRSIRNDALASERVFQVSAGGANVAKVIALLTELEEKNKDPRNRCSFLLQYQPQAQTGIIQISALSKFRKKITAANLTGGRYKATLFTEQKFGMGKQDKSIAELLEAWEA